MMRDRPLLVLLAAAAASYPALGLGWCITMLLAGYPQARALWELGRPNALAALVLVAVAAVAVGNATRVLGRGLWQTYRVHRWVTLRRVPPADDVAVELGTRVRVVATSERLAITVGLWRPYVVVSSALLATTSTSELRAILAHEHAHARRRDPLRLLAAKTLAAHLWFVPLATELRGRARRGYELIADRHAVHSCGRAAVAGALLQATASPGATQAAAAPFSTPELLEDRVSQLESGRAPRPAPMRKLRAAGTVAVAMAFVATVAGAWTFMLITCPCAGGTG